MGASLLPSKEIRELCETFAVAASRPGDAEDARLFRELVGDPEEKMGPAWIVVLDGRGQVLARMTADSAGACNQENVSKFAALVAAKIQECLGRRLSLEELEQRWRRGMTDEVLEEWLPRLQEGEEVHKAHELCESLAEAREGAVRGRWLLKGFILRGECWPDLGTPEKIRAHSERGRKHFLAHPELPEARRAGELLLEVHRGSFDAAARMAAEIALLEREGAALKGDRTAALAARLEEMRRRREWFVQDWTSRVAQFADPRQADNQHYYRALLGDAEATARFFDQVRFRDHPPYRKFVEDAREKLKAGKK